ncbi:MAG TPA: proton-conducting transporter membrane subunit [Candidatus Thermoplasmatota archaeon]|nr:proton-conducting transporter membrane subunit [Candidatus Thermoplasmatota archaeon]
MDPVAAAVTAMAALLALGALVGWLAGRSPRGLAPTFGLAALAGLAACYAALATLASGQATRIALPATLPLAAPTLLLDGLAAWFLLLVGVGAVAASVYATSYLRHAAARGPVRLQGACFHLFLLAMAGVVLANDALWFLIAWETMTLASLALVLAGDRGPEGRKAGIVYAATMHVGTGFILAALLLATQQAGSWDFDAFRRAGPAMAEPVRSAVFAFALLGFGTKAGIVPLHGWLPLAHPAAPSHVSALMSGVMVKMGLLMFVRFAFEFLGPPGLAAGGAVLAIGLASALTGVLFALVERDVKRALAFSTIENVGLLFTGLGVALLLQGWHQPALAALALGATLLHALNHMAFKALLFLGAGAVVEATGTRDLEALGGLARRMPRVALLFLVGCAAIAALPPLNGFASEWMLFQAFVGLVRAGSGGPFVSGLIVGSAALLALASGLVAAAMVRLYGGLFTGLPRSAAAERAHDPGAAMVAPMVALALLCAGLGLGAGWVAPLAVRLGASLVGAPSLAAIDAGPGALPGLAPAQPLAIAALLLAGFAVAMLAGRGWRRHPRGSVWACGEVTPAPRFLQSPTAYGEAAAVVFANLLRPRFRLEAAEGPGGAQGLRYERSHEDVFASRLYEPLTRLFRVASLRARVVQSGSLQRYLGYLLGAFVLSLAVVSWR